MRPIGGLAPLSLRRWAYVQEGVELIMTRLREGMSYTRSVAPIRSSPADLASYMELYTAVYKRVGPVHDRD